jgi:hypothetical protein
MSNDQTEDRLPRIEDFRSDLTPEQIRAAEARNTRAIAMQGYLQAVPAFLHMRQLTEFIQGRRQLAPDEPPLGGWFVMRALADAGTDNVMPNVDTLYGAAYLLLDRQGPVVLDVPPIPGRYYSVAILDAYFNNFAIVSPRTFGNDGGSYLLAPPGWTGPTPEGIRAVFDAPTPALCLLQRIFTRNPTEYEALHVLQDAIHLTPLDRWLAGESGFPPVDLAAYEIEAMRATRDPLQFFEYTDFYTGVNPPPASDGGLAELCRTVGVGPGSRVPEDPHLREAIRQGAADAQAIMNARLSEAPVRSGWRVPDPNVGRAGPFLLTRAVTQVSQIGSFVPEEATYFSAHRDSEDRPLDGGHSYTLTFRHGALPPLREFGFWSLTMYNEAALLADNPLDRYILRPDSPGLTSAPDGSLTLHIQRDQPRDAPEGNWLPAPAGVFSVALRAYLPQPGILDGTWFPPAIVRVD